MATSLVREASIASDWPRIVHGAARANTARAHGGCQRGQLLFLDLKGSFFSRKGMERAVCILAHKEKCSRELCKSLVESL